MFFDISKKYWLVMITAFPMTIVLLQTYVVTYEQSDLCKIFDPRNITLLLDSRWLQSSTFLEFPQTNKIAKSSLRPSKFL